MRRILMIVAVLSLLTVPLLAQDTKADLFAGYQYTHIGVTNCTGDCGASFNGWNAQLTYWANNWLGLTGDFSGAYRSGGYGLPSNVGIHQHTFMFGPTIGSHKNPKFVPFAHALFGAANCSVSNFPTSQCFGVDSTSFAMAFGGGVDVGSKRLAFRIGQFDYIYTRFGSEANIHQNDFRYSAGIVFRF